MEEIKVDWKKEYDNLYKSMKIVVSKEADGRVQIKLLNDKNKQLEESRIALNQIVQLQLDKANKDIQELGKKIQDLKERLRKYEKVE